MGRLSVRLGLAAAAALLAAGCGPDLPSDAEIIAAFDANRSAFHSVRDTLLRTGGIERVEEGQTAGLPLEADERARIEALMGATGVDLIVVTKSQLRDSVEFSMHLSGFVFGGASKTLTWSNRKPSPPLLDSLDDPTDRRGFVTDSWFRASRPLDGGWYLSLSKD